MENYSLFELNEYVRRILALNLSEPVWIRAEIAQFDVSKGHAYVTLIEKEAENGEIIAESRANIWASTYRRLKRKIGKDLKSILQEGMEVLIEVTVDFHERYGLKLVIQNVDISYTIGKMALQRQKVIEALQKKDLLGKNTLLELPLVLQRIAVISSSTAAGLQDYLQQIGNNPYGYEYINALFPASVQGINAEKEIIAQLEKIALRKEDFDIVIIIRGGGAKLDLAAFDAFNLCASIANFPLPVLSGIGHETDDSVADLVVHTALKTPTAVADYIIHHNMQFEASILEIGQFLQNTAFEYTQSEKLDLQSIEQYIQTTGLSILTEASYEISALKQQLDRTVVHSLEKEKEKLIQLDKICDILSPELTLQRGFSMTLKKGKVINTSSKLKKGDKITTLFADNQKVDSIVD